MLNLSDKELDRLAREAANEYDPGNPAGPGSWDRMHLRLDSEMGSPSFNPFRSIRRTPFYYAPAILLLVGVSYFLLRPSHAHPGAHPPGSPSTSKTDPSGSPPIAWATPTRPTAANADKPIKNENNTYSPTSTPAAATPANDVIARSRPEPAGSSGSIVSSGRSKTSGSITGSAQMVASGRSVSSGRSVESGRSVSSGQSGLSRRPTSSGKPVASGKIPSSGRALPKQGSSLGQPASDQLVSRERTLPGHLNATDLPVKQGPENTNAGTVSHSNIPTRSRGRGHQHNDNSGTNPLAAGMASSSPLTGDAAQPSLSLSVVRGIQPLRQPEPAIDDAGLRKFGRTTVAKVAEPVNPGK